MFFMVVVVDIVANYSLRVKYVGVVCFALVLFRVRSGIVAFYDFRVRVIDVVSSGLRLFRVRVGSGFIRN